MCRVRPGAAVNAGCVRLSAAAGRDLPAAADAQQRFAKEPLAFSGGVLYNIKLKKYAVPNESRGTPQGR